jgi:hypothetical protein
VAALQGSELLAYFPVPRGVGDWVCTVDSLWPELKGSTHCEHSANSSKARRRPILTSDIEDLARLDPSARLERI